MSSPRVEQTLRKISDFLIYSFLEWVIIIWLYIIGLLAFLCSEFSRLLNLNPPCWLCTRIDHIFKHKSHDFYYNKSVCEAHKRDISSLAYCQVHSKLSDIKSMCDRCLLSFATERDSDIDAHKFILQKDIDAFVEEDHKILKGSDYGTAKKGSVNICSCCGEPLKRNSNKSDKHPSTRATAFANSSISCPRAPTPELTKEDVRNGKLPHIRTKLQPESDLQQDENKIGAHKEKANEDVKDAAMPSLPDSEDPSEQTPSFIKEHRFFKISLTESGASSSPRFANPSSPRFAYPSSPRFANRQARKLQIEKEIFAETNDRNAANGAEGELSDLLKKEARLDRKSLVDLYMELEEERSASAEAANNALAMITRLQAEKAAMQMEALHYQRMITEQAEYDQEALKVMQDQVKVLEVDLETYREKFGPLEKEDLEEYEGDEDYQEFGPEFDTDENYYRPTPY
ncbi:putative myosin-binding protein 5 [Heracleum sosnowskyi]|uniref:Myosin-binding protein 5 n=1 Tax=Heracleum sosnowskyi TaxID=360622 RepID=A0AAD8H3Y1_9APIA|nr:putative myosin-binding protein 5 [Heracleum sosnowskyi]